VKGAASARGRVREAKTDYTEKDEEFIPVGMKHSDFTIGCEFVTATGRWRCTDVGTRTIVAIKLDKKDDPSWYDGPPYGVLEQVFDEYDMEGCNAVEPPVDNRDKRLHN
jgi:hypothetical protein